MSYLTKVLNAGKILWQSGDDDGLPEPALLIHVDNGGTLVIEQEGREIILNWGTIEPLNRLLREMAKAKK